MKHKLYKLALCLVVGTLIILVSTPIATKAIPYEDKVQQQYEKALDGWILRLIQQESGGREVFKILDVNGKYSYSCGQFQLRTFQSYIRRYNLFPDTETTELENLIYDCDIQKNLAKMMIKENWNNWTHWRTSVLLPKVGFPPKK